MVDFIKLYPEVVNNWARAWSETERERPWAYKRVQDSMTISQMEGKLWLVSEMENLNLGCKRAALLGGWFAQFITPLLIDTLGFEFVGNYDIDKDAQLISYKFNRRYKTTEKYKAYSSNLLIKSFKKLKQGPYDCVINTSCEHMYPMRLFRKLNPDWNGFYILQSTNEKKYVDHINCVNSAEELSQQSEMKEVLYQGEKLLNTGMTRFMVIGT